MLKNLAKSLSIKLYHFNNKVRINKLASETRLFIQNLYLINFYFFM
nr:MAG TPA: hypothetical protein [Caudoviricetes sp.]